MKNPIVWFEGAGTDGTAPCNFYSDVLTVPCVTDPQGQLIAVSKEVSQ